MTKQIDLIKENIIDQARYFLESADEFYPFGTALKNGLITPIGVYFSNDNPSSSEVFSILENKIIKSVESGEYSVAGIGLDVKINNIDNFLQIKIYYSNIMSEILFKYFKVEEKYLFMEVLK